MQRIKYERVAQMSRKFIPRLKFSDILRQGISRSHVSENQSHQTNLLPRVIQNSNPIKTIPQLNVMNLSKTYKKSVFKARNEQQTQLN